MLIHAPRPWSEMQSGTKRYFEENQAVWKALEEAYKAGSLKAIGVSNFQIDDLQNIMSDCEIKPMANQICIHIGNTPKRLIDFCKEVIMCRRMVCPEFTQFHSWVECRN